MFPTGRRLILYETRAIWRYIAAKYPASGLIPSEPKALALFEQAASVELSNFDPSASKIGLETVSRTKLTGISADPALMEKEFVTLEKNLDGYDRILAKQRYVAGDTLTLVDLFHIPFAPYIELGGSDLMTRKPNVARWYKELISRPSWLAYMDGVKTTTAY